MWPFSKKQWNLIGYADLTWIEVTKSGVQLNKGMRVIFCTQGDKRIVKVANYAQYKSCVTSGVSAFTETWAWENGGPLPREFERSAPTYTASGNVIQLKAKE